ncbi:MAG: deoxyribonuclease IV [Planctomycetota bacterium JB042]
MAKRKATAPVERSELAPAIPDGVLLGAHMSIAGGHHHAVEAAVRAGCTALQIFTKGNNQWRAKPLEEEGVRAFAAARRQHGIDHVVAHASYLINLGTPDDALWEKSVDAFVVELERCEALDVSHLIFHPGAHVGSGEEAGLARVVEGIDEAHRRTSGLAVKTTVEITAGQGTCLGHTFEHLAAIVSGVAAPERVAVCLDTCHLLAAGYDLRTPGGYDATFEELDEAVGLGKVEAFHLNDSKKDLGCRVDRHEEIGEGFLGDAPFRMLMNDDRFRGVPMVLETPKGDDELAADTRNLRRLVGMIEG